jgi:hypothetical protein
MTVVLSVCFLFVLLNVKHYLADFQWQTEYHLQKYSKVRSVQFKALSHHSAIHGILTAVVLVLHYYAFGIVEFSTTLLWAFVGLSLMDTVIHFVVDLVKVEASRHLTPADRLFWIELGVDQLSHNVTYCLIVFMYYSTMWT